jgi:hypothetical protein
MYVFMHVCISMDVCVYARILLSRNTHTKSGECWPIGCCVWAPPPISATSNMWLPWHAWIGAKPTIKAKKLADDSSMMQWTHFGQSCGSTWVWNHTYITSMHTDLRRWAKKEMETQPQLRCTTPRNTIAQISGGAPHNFSIYTDCRTLGVGRVFANRVLYPVAPLWSSPSTNTSLHSIPHLSPWQCKHSQARGEYKSNILCTW